MAELSSDMPEWILPPGYIINNLLKEKEIVLDDFAFECGISSLVARRLIGGVESIDATLASRLSIIIGSSAAFWLKCERNYREDLERNFHGYVNTDVNSWVKSLPLQEMESFGWINLHNDTTKQVQECLKFFGVATFEDWMLQNSNINLKTNFRTSSVFKSNPAATLVWLRWAEDKAEEATCEAWDPNKFRASLPEIRSLSRIHDPRRFVPKLREICARSGVAVVIAPAPKGCKASGATKIIRERKAMIVLSYRYYSDDQFWFTFFHEAAHLILHGESEFLLEETCEMNSSDLDVDKKEEEANKFAYDVLLPNIFQHRLAKLPASHDAYLRFAREVGVAPGIIVGQMQLAKLLPFEWLNKLKRRFEWQEIREQGIIP